MKILVIDRDPLTAQFIKSRLEPLGHEVQHEEIKNNAVERLMADTFDVVFLDPSPLTSPRPLILSIRRGIKNYPYIFLLSESASRQEALKLGANDIANKPLDGAAGLDDKLANAERLTQMVKKIGDDSQEFPSAGGIIAKSAFNQLLLSAVDRADRYGEKAFILFITLTNYKDMRDLDGPYAADYATAKLSQYLVLLRRQSDIIGQVAKNGYALILQRPVYDTEPLEAASRFAAALSEFKDITPEGAAKAEIAITLLDVPVGAQVIEHLVKPGQGVWTN